MSNVLSKHRPSTLAQQIKFGLEYKKLTLQSQLVFGASKRRMITEMNKLEIQKAIEDLEELHKQQEEDTPATPLEKAQTWVLFNSLNVTQREVYKVRHGLLLTTELTKFGRRVIRNNINKILKEVL